MKNAILLFFFLSIPAIVMSQSKKKLFHLVVGTYTNADKSNGIHVYQFDATSGVAEEKAKITEITNPSYLAVSSDRKNVYAVSEASGGGRINAFSFDPKSGRLAFVNSVSGGNGPCYVSVDKKKQFAFAGNYGGGSLTAVRINKDGSLSDDIQTIQHEGSSVNKSRQDKPHVHAAVLSPDERYVLAPDLGTDKVNIYSFEASEAKPLTAGSQSFTSVKGGGGPRHLAFAPDGKHAYLVLEMEGSVAAMSYKDGKMEVIQYITMLAPGFNGKVGAADIHVSPDGKYLYASNRGEANEIVYYAIGKDGKLAYAGRQGEGINTPRNFAIDPTGNFLLVANQNGNDIIVFKRDMKTGALSPSGQKIAVDKPVCLKFVSID